MPDTTSDDVLKVLQRLDKRFGLKYKSGEKRAWIRCYKHKNGQEHTPSLMINVKRHLGHSIGSAKCMACGYKANWPDVFRHLTGQNLTDHDISEFSAQLFDDNVSLADDDDAESIDMSNMLPWEPHLDWRSISGRLVAQVGGRLAFSEKVEKQQLFLPVFVNQQLVGGINANLVKEGRRNYFNTPGPWVHASGLFPFDFTKEFIIQNDLNYVVLVEGPRDALNCLQNNIPAIAIMGTQTWSDVKADLILSLGVKTVVLALDPDEAGEKGRQVIHKSLKHETRIVKYDFPQETKNGDKVDPGNMPPKVLKDFQKKLNTLNQTLQRQTHGENHVKP